MPRSLLVPLAAFFCAASWSGSWITGKLAVTHAPLLEISTVRFVIAALMLAAIAIATRTNLGRGNLWPVIFAGVFGYFGYNAFVFVGLTMAPASDGASEWDANVAARVLYKLIGFSLLSNRGFPRAA